MSDSPSRPSRSIIGLSRRSLLTAAAVLPLAADAFSLGKAVAQTAPAAGAAIPPILFVHGNGDTAGLWLTTFWRMESNGVPRAHLAAINFTDPLARTEDAVPKPNTSSVADQLRELSDAIATLKARSGAARIALVGSSRGGNAIRSYLKTGATDISHAVLCGTPNHGVYAWDEGLGGEFNGRGPFLSGLNAGESEVTDGTAYLTLRSDGLDKFAQPDGRFVGKPGIPTNVTIEGPALKGATNLVLGALDHREVAFHPRAFREIYKFIAGREPVRIDIVPEPSVQIGGLVTGTPGGVQTNRPVTDATVEVYRVDPASGERIGGAVYSVKTGADGKWGPATVDPIWPLEIVLAQAGAPTTYIYRSPFPRSSDIVHLRAGRPLDTAKDAGCVVLMSRPRGYFGLPRDVVLIDGNEPTDVKTGVPTDSVTTLRLPATEAGRPVTALFNQERIVVRAWPAAENRIVIAELTY